MHKGSTVSTISKGTHQIRKREVGGGAAGLVTASEQGAQSSTELSVGTICFVHVNSPKEKGVKEKGLAGRGYTATATEATYTSTHQQVNKETVRFDTA